MSKDLQTYKDLSLTLVTEKPEYAVMIQSMEEFLPVINAAAQNFQKTQSQFMDNVLTVSHPTPLRNVRQILAEMKKTEEALKEVYFKNKKKDIEIRVKQGKLKDTNLNDLDIELLELEILEIKSQLESSQGYIGGAIRKLINYNEQYKSILASLGKDDFTEADFEEEEEAYHIMKAFDQGTTAARSRGFQIDEGNLIYLTQLGINCGLAQKYVTNYLTMENDIINKGQIPAPDFYNSFLKEMANVFTGCAKSISNQKGMTGEISKIATLGYKEL